MRIRKVPALAVGAGIFLLCGVNVAAAMAPPDVRVPFVDPFARTADGSVAQDGSGAASWHPAEPPAAPAVPEAPDEAGLPGGSTDAGGAASSADTSPDQPASAAAPVSREVARSAVQLPQTLDAWVSAVASATGIPARAVRSYGNATLEIGIEDPSCRLGWPTLAGIGWIESGHGTHGHATLGDDGVPSVPIVGPALDGSPGRAAIHSTAQSIEWHGDPVWDHAVGPMQFIPSTWARWAADGDGDGVENPQDMDDAALATARYLCAGSRDLSTWDGWHAAVLSYNHAESYVQSVYGQASAYASAAAR
ncbi:MAG TPA: lytic murein transglycosylase [Cellulomonas sp.]